MQQSHGLFATAKLLVTVDTLLLVTSRCGLYLWPFDLKRLKHSDFLHQIWAKSNNPWLSYSDLNIDNLSAVRHLEFDRKWFTILRGPEKHQHVKFQHNRPMLGWVIDYSTNFQARFSGRQHCSPNLSEFWQATEIKFGVVIKQSLALPEHLWMNTC